MSRILIVYETFEGQTGKIADYVSRELINKNHSVDSYHAKKIPKNLSMEKFDGFVIGAPVRYAGYPASIRKWIRNHAKILSDRPSAFFSVCLGILQKDNAKAQKQERDVVENLFQMTGWHPHLWTIFGGALQYSKYGWIEKKVMRYIAGKAHGDTDVNRDYEYTRWDEVKTFVQEFESHIVQKVPSWEQGMKTDLKIAAKHDAPTVNVR